MVEVKKQQQRQPPQWWWFDHLSDSNQNQKRSSWLQSTLSELDEKMRAMLKLIEEDADSFAQRAEMYYKKRPQLISMVEEFYRTHRSLAERYDQLKSESGTTRNVAPWASPISATKCRQEKLMSLNSIDKAYDSYSETYEMECEEESDVEDPEPEEEEVEVHPSKEEVLIDDGNNDNQVKMKFMEEIERLKEENRAQKEQLIQKDEEKRDVIRQLSLAMDLLREENQDLRKRILVAREDSPKKQNHHSESTNKTDGFWKKLFNLSQALIES